MIIGEIIKNARLTKGYTQEELGEMLGVQKSAVAKWESGRVKNIKRDTLAALSKILDIPPVLLVSDIEENPVETANRIADIVLNNEMLELIETYNSLSEDNKKLAKAHLNFLASMGRD